MFNTSGPVSRKVKSRSEFTFTNRLLLFTTGVRPVCDLLFSRNRHRISKPCMLLYTSIIVSVKQYNLIIWDMLSYWHYTHLLILNKENNFLYRNTWHEILMLPCRCQHLILSYWPLILFLLVVYLFLSFLILRLYMYTVTFVCSFASYRNKSNIRMLLHTKLFLKHFV